MKPLRAITLLGIVCFAQANAQIIGVKTYPILTDDESLSLPSERQAMGNISIGLADNIRDPFVNPAAVMSIEHGYAFGLSRWSHWKFEQDIVNTPPYSHTGEMSSAGDFSLPVGFMQRSENFGMAATGSYQHLISHQGIDVRGTNLPWEIGLGVAIPGTGLALGASASITKIHGIDGVPFLYPNSTSVDVSGMSQDFRLGLVGTFAESKKLSLVAGVAFFKTAQHAEYTDATPIDNEDQNRQWFIQGIYRTAVSDELTLGLLATGNWKEYPKIPNYPITGIPHDPGTTLAFNIGVGGSWKASSTSLFALEYLVEPIIAKTWVEATQDQDLGNGQIIHKGEVQQRNNYTFLNHIFRAGIEMMPTQWLKMQFGSELHYYSFDYYSKDMLRGTERTVSPQNQWSEVSLTGGMTFAIGNLSLAYHAEMLIGRGLLERDRWWWLVGPVRASNDFYLPPNAWVSLTPVPVFTHQLSAFYSFDLF